ncbi:MAG: universal stress protein [Nitrospirota bacterium]
MFKKILVPLDGSKLAENALDPVEVLAKQSNAEVILFHALSYVTVYTDIEQPAGICTVCEADEKQKAVVERYLSKLAGQLNSKGVKTSWVVSTGERVPNQKENNISLIVMSTCGVSGAYPAVLGSVAEKVIKGGPETAILIMCPKGVEKLCRV